MYYLPCLGSMVKLMLARILKLSVIDNCISRSTTCMRLMLFLTEFQLLHFLPRRVLTTKRSFSMLLCFSTPPIRSSLKESAVPNARLPNRGDKYVYSILIQVSEDIPRFGKSQLNSSIATQECRQIALLGTARLTGEGRSWTVLDFPIIVPVYKLPIAGSF